MWREIWSLDTTWMAFIWTTIFILILFQVIVNGRAEVDAEKFSAAPILIFRRQWRDIPMLKEYMGNHISVESPASTSLAEFQKTLYFDDIVIHFTHYFCVKCGNHEII